MESRISKYLLRICTINKTLSGDKCVFHALIQNTIENRLTSEEDKIKANQEDESGTLEELDHVEEREL